MSLSVEQKTALFSAFFDNGPIGNVIAARDGIIVQVNVALTTILGCSVEELTGKSFLSVTHPEDRPAAQEAMRALLAGERENTVLEQRVVAQDGSTVWVQVTTGVQRDSNGTVLHFLAHVVDVTQRRQAELAGRESEVRYRRLFEAAKDGILILDAVTGRIEDLNPFIAELTGYGRADLLGKHLWDIGPFRDTAASKLSFAELQAQDYVRYDDLPLKTRDGRTVDVEFISNVYLVNGKKVIQCNVRDITERKRVEREHARMVMAIDQAAEAVVITDPKGAIEYVNPAFETGTGYSREEVLGKNPSLLNSGAQSEPFYRELWQMIAAGRTWRGRFVNKRKDGTRFTEDATISPVRNRAGVITSYVAVKRDISATLALEAQFLQAQKMEAVGRLAGGVAHDFNNLLSVILSYAHLLGDDLGPGDPIRTDIEEIRKAALRAAELTKQLLAFSRHQVLEPRVVNIDQILAGMEKMLERILGADVELAILPTSGLWSVKADPGQVGQVVMNLVVNARDAMPRGGKLTVETSNVELDENYAREHHEVRVGPYVEIAITDTGTGMDAETQARIFEPFFTTKEKGKGTGLGLATVFGIVKQSGGHVFVYSELGHGTTFKVYLPKVDDLAEVVAALPAEPKLVYGNATVLLVEDEEQLRVLARTILRRQGYVVLDASNGGEALLLCEQHGANIDLLLTDVVLPRMSGRQLAERLAPLRPEMKVLYMSGYTNDAILHHGIISSGVPFLQKPFTPTSLTQKVAEVLSGARVRL